MLSNFVEPLYTQKNKKLIKLRSSLYIYMLSGPVIFPGELDLLGFRRAYVDLMEKKVQVNYPINLFASYTELVNYLLNYLLNSSSK